MNEFFTDLLTAVITAVIPVLSVFAITAIRKVRDKAIAQTDNIKRQDYIWEIADAVSAAVAATSQTYVDALKKNGAFTKEAQEEAMQKALAACIAAIGPAAQDFITSAYGDLTEYLVNRIEAEVRKQKVQLPTTQNVSVALEGGATAVAASTAAATAASIAQNAIQQINAEATTPEK